MNISKEDRLAIAKGLRVARWLDRKKSMPDPRLNREKRDRSAERYAGYLRGYQATLEYIRSLSSQLVVDVGAGTSRAIAEIAKSESGIGLEFQATGLVFDPNIEKHLGWSRYRLVPAETMRGFADESVGGLLSVWGALAYSRRRHLVVAQARRVLVPGGILKASVTLSVPNKPEVTAMHIEDCAQIEAALAAHDFVYASEDYEVQGRLGNMRVYLAVKPIQGNELEAAKLASKLLVDDLATMPPGIDFSLLPAL